MLFNKGFTLIEILLVVSLLMVMGASVTTSFLHGIRVYQRLNYVHQEEELAFLMERVTHDLKNAVNYSSIPFSGSEQSISFATLIQELLHQSSPMGFWPVQVEYRYDPNSEEVLRLEKINAFFGSDEVTSREILAKEIHSLAFKFSDNQSRLPPKMNITLDYGGKPFLKKVSEDILIPVSFYDHREQ